MGYVHNLSKRTALYATLSHIDIEHAGNNAAGLMSLTPGGGDNMWSQPTGGYAPRMPTG